MYRCVTISKYKAHKGLILKNKDAVYIKQSDKEKKRGGLGHLSAEPPNKYFIFFLHLSRINFRNLTQLFS